MNPSISLGVDHKEGDSPHPDRWFGVRQAINGPSIGFVPHARLSHSSDA
ncbi:MAG TPA: hypothetical protein VGC99_04600 [Candidatus Tectomicrobia bacterium]